MFTGQAIFNLGILQNADAGQIRPASYDLRIGRIYAPPDGILNKLKPNEVDEYKLPPQGMALIVQYDKIDGCCCILNLFQ